MSDQKMHIGATIRTYRENVGLSLSKLARDAGISKGYLSSIETGATESPSYDTIMRIAWALGANPLLWWKPPSSVTPNGNEWDTAIITQQRQRIDDLECAIRDHLPYLHPVSARGEDAKIALQELANKGQRAP